MKFVKLETKEQFNNLTKGDLVIVHWRNDELTAYNISGLIFSKAIENPSLELILCAKKKSLFYC